MDWIILLAAIFCCALATVGFALAVDPVARKKMLKWRCLTAIARRKKSLKRRLAAEKLKLLKEWDLNPAQQCAAAFVEELSQITDKTSGELRAEIVANAIGKAKNQQWDFVERFGQKYDQLIQINTKSVAIQMANSLPENAEYIMQNIALDDQAKDSYFDGEIRKALAKGTSSLNKIKLHIRKLEKAFIRFGVDPEGNFFPLEFKK